MTIDEWGIELTTQNSILLDAILMAIRNTPTPRSTKADQYNSIVDNWNAQMRDLSEKTRKQ